MAQFRYIKKSALPKSGNRGDVYHTNDSRETFIVLNDGQLYLLDGLLAPDGPIAIPGPKGEKGDPGRGEKGEKGERGDCVFLGDPEMAEAIRKLHIRLVNIHAAMCLALEDAGKLNDVGQRSLVLSILRKLKANAGI